MTNKDNKENWKSADQRNERKQRLQEQKAGGRKLKKSHSGKKILITVLVIAFILGSVAILMIDGGYFERNKVAGIVNGKHEVSALECNYMVGNNFNALYQSAAFTPNGKSLLTLTFPGEEGVTILRDSLLEGMEQQISEVYALSDLAEENGIEMDDENKEYLKSLQSRLEMAAVQQQMSPDDLFSRLFGRGANFKSLRPIMERQILAALYQEQTTDAYEFTDAEYEAEYEAHKDDYDFVSFHAFAVHPDNPAVQKEEPVKTEADAESEETVDEQVEETTAEVAEETEVEVTEAEGTEPSEAETEEASDQQETTEPSEDMDEIEKLIAQAKNKAQEMADTVKSEEDFKEWALKLASPEQKPMLEAEENPTLVKKAVRSQLQPDMADWLFDQERKAGDTTVLDVNGVPSVLYFVSRSRDDNSTYNSRHILIKDTTDEDTKVTEERAQNILDRYLEGEQTEEAFAALATSLSEDMGSKANGGLYENVEPGQFVPAYEEWCLDPERKPGDVGLVRVESANYSGYHIIYFIGSGEPVWKETAHTRLANERFEQEMETIREGYSFERQEAGMKYVLPYNEKEMEAVLESIKEAEDGQGESNE
ncbi:MAG: peptidylprolyl isomerase [Eubacteriales bacterium]|nr:peptidylprolyl isomerase [Eubacteriales bacterium]